MDERTNPELISAQAENPDTVPVPPKTEIPTCHAGKRDFLFAGAIALIGILMCNFVFFGGFHIGFAVIAIAAILCSVAYLHFSGHRLDWYSGSLLVLSVIISAGFGRSADGFVKFVMLLFLVTAVNLSLCIMAKQNRRDPGSLTSLLDAPRALFRLGFGGMKKSGQGFVWGVRHSGETGRKTGAVMLGLVICIPILGIMIPLLMDADAAFEGLLNLLPEVNLGEYFISGIYGFLLCWILYSRGIRLNRMTAPLPAVSAKKGIHPLTISTILTAVCLLYLVYLFSQLAYFVGGFAGILPEEFTMAEYARRGFFEMAWLCAINLLLICGSVALVKKDGKAPGFIRGCCLFLGLITIFFVSTASAKMFLYIGSYGLTRLRVLTEVIMLWMALTTVTVCLWLFMPKLPYMKVVILTAMVIGAVVFWVDVDTVVAKYNVEHYHSGDLETVDMDHMGSLGPAAVPYIRQLADDPDPEISQHAKEILRKRSYTVEDFRGWNRDYARAAEILKQFHEAEEKQAYALLREYLKMEIPEGTMRKQWNYRPELYRGQQFLTVVIPDEAHEAFSLQLTDASWKMAPLPVSLQHAIYGSADRESLFPDRDSIVVPFEGYYCFVNQYPGVEDPSATTQLFTQDYQCFYLAWYNTVDHLLCFFRVDQTPAVQ